MIQGWVKSSALAAIFVGALAASGARAQDAAPAAPTTPSADDATQAAGAEAKKAAHTPQKSVAKAKKLPSVAVIVSNMRTVGLVELTAAPSGGADAVKIAGPLGEGKKIVAHVAHDKACLFDLHGTFADGATSDEQSVDLCKDKKINLVE